MEQALMSWLSKIFGSGAKAASDAVVDTAKGVADIVERWAPSDKAKHDMYMDIQKVMVEAQANARAYDPRTTATGRAAEFLNVLVDAVCRLIRPGVTILIVGGVFGWWEIQTQTLDPLVLSWGESVIGFWFGIRAITRDIPSLLKMLVELKRGK